MALINTDFIDVLIKLTSATSIASILIIGVVLKISSSGVSLYVKKNERG